jgi:hypothetical protein
MARIAPGVIPIKDQNPYETIRAVAYQDEDIEENDIVVVSGYTGDVLVVAKADATKVEHRESALFLARTGAAAGRALWIQPWRVTTRLSTEETPTHTPVFLGKDGKHVFEIPSNGTMWYKRRVGTVIDKNVIHFHLG